ncbi:MAG: class I SAM-dependent methyltransferase [Bacillota bacterium]|nr:class I SAM-dependent methyltransferase [Bacillota bacterium]
MVRLSERLEKIAGFVDAGMTAADVGTDHGYIPIYLIQNGISPYVIASDINAGPLEKMEENLQKHMGDDRKGIIMRHGPGLEVLKPGEADAVVIAGMGGLLIEEILGKSPEVTDSVKRFILQPRNAPDKLRKWLLDKGFRITEEVLAKESRFVWEIICAEPGAGECAKDEYFSGSPEQYIVGQHVIRNSDPLLEEFVSNKIRVEREIAENAGKSVSFSAAEQKKEAEEKIRLLEGIMKNVGQKR